MTTPAPIPTARIEIRIAARPTADYPFAVTGDRDAIVEYGPRTVGIQELLCRTLREARIAAVGMQSGFLAAGLSCPTPTLAPNLRDPHHDANA